MMQISRNADHIFRGVRMPLGWLPAGRPLLGRRTLARRGTARSMGLARGKAFRRQIGDGSREYGDVSRQIATEIRPPKGNWRRCFCPLALADISRRSVGRPMLGEIYHHHGSVGGAWDRWFYFGWDRGFQGRNVAVHTTKNDKMQNQLDIRCVWRRRSGWLIDWRLYAVLA